MKLKTFDEFNQKNFNSINESNQTWIIWKKEEGEDKASIYNTYDSRRNAETALFNVLAKYEDGVENATAFNIISKESWDKLVKKGKVKS
jgi:hypothetical protein